MFRRAFSLSLAIAAAPYLTACSEDPAGACSGGDCLFKVERRLLKVETRLANAEAVAGVAQDVTCFGIWDDGAELALAPAEATVIVTPSERVSIDAHAITVEVAGTYEIMCAAAEGSPEVVPATLRVTPGNPASVTAAVDPATVAAGDAVNVDCALVDRYGNTVPSSELKVRASPSRGVTVAGTQITGELIGDYEVTCSLDSARLDSAPVNLTVTAGDPTMIITQLDRYSVEAGQSVAVTCTMVDAYQNPVVVDTEYTVSPSPVSQDPDRFMSETAGDYWVTCVQTDFGLSSEQVLLRVLPSLPATLRIVGLTPMQPVYAQTDVVEVDVQIHDTYGNEVQAADWSITSMPSSAVLDVGSDQVVLIGDGEITLVASVDSMTHMGQTVEDTITITVDGVPPEIEFTFPSRAELVLGAPNRSLTMRGRVTDATSGVSELIINGDLISVDASGNFTAPMRPGWGVNMIEASAIDVAGNREDIIQSFQYASEYKRASPSRRVSGRIPDGVIAHLGQRALDDNSSDVDDLATIAKLAVQHADINALIPNPVTTYNSDCSVLFVTIRGALRLHVDDVDFGTPRIDITAINGGLRLRVEVPNVDVDLRTSGDVCDIGLGLRGNASASRVVVQGDLQVRRVNGQVRVTMPSRSVSISGLDIDLDLPVVIDWAVDGIISLFSGMISNRLESAFGDVIQDEIPPVIAGFLDSMDLGTGFNLPAPVSMRLNLATGLGMMAFDSSGGDVGLDTTIYATRRLPSEPRGGITQERVTLPSFSSSRPLGVALSYDLLNQALYSLWYGGGLDIDIDEDLLPAQFNNGGQMVQLEASLKGLMAPVLKPTGNSQYPVELQVGDLELDIAVDGVPNLPTIDVVAYAHVFMQASATINPAGEIILGLGPNPRIALEFSTPLDGIVDLAAFIDQLETTLGSLVPQLFSQVIGGIPIPSFDLSSMAGNYLPPGIVLGLGNARTRFHPSYLMLEGSLVQIP